MSLPRRSAAPSLIIALMAAVALAVTSCAPGRTAALKPPAPDLGAVEREVVGKLAGQVEIRPGLKLAARASLDDRKAVRAFLIETWQGLGLAVQTQDYSAEGQNIFAVVGPADPATETIVFGAHYDSPRNSPGANDNATGAALVTAAAAHFARQQGLARRILFVLFDEEERGLRGSRALAQKLKDEGARIHSVHTVDQMGWDSDGDRAVELELPYEGAEALYAGVAATLKPPIPLITTKEAGSDHSAFRRQGFKAVGLTEEYRSKDTTPHFHKPGDTAETVNFPYLASTTSLVIGVLAVLASGR